MPKDSIITVSGQPSSSSQLSPQSSEKTQLSLAQKLLSSVVIFPLGEIVKLRDVGINDPLEFPLALDQLLNLEMAFNVKWQPRWKNCSVVILFRDEPFIKQLKAPWDIVEDLEIISKHNLNPITPTGKRHFPGVQVNQQPQKAYVMERSLLTSLRR
ncbi:unnamed protein product [Vicia faba]|uniref:Uncharacterized protein n=1 Tax=Vicia faba TaxID=3906 RepID=A0AAV1BAP7_VICFA|nr:unnamed protein product [Vicia faba]